jgi:Ca2+-binding RTX toxin-like protein
MAIVSFSGNVEEVAINSFWADDAVISPSFTFSNWWADENESLQLFEEAQDVVLQEDIFVHGNLQNPDWDEVDAVNDVADLGTIPTLGTIAAGTEVDSYFIAFKNPNPGTSVTVQATITFDAPIIGLMGDPVLINPTNDLFVPYVARPLADGGTLDTSVNGLDTIEILGDGNILRVTFRNSSGVDPLRVLTASGTVNPDDGGDTTNPPIDPPTDNNDTNSNGGNTDTSNDNTNTGGNTSDSGNDGSTNNDSDNGVVEDVIEERPLIIRATQVADTLKGNALDNKMRGLSGDDKLRGKAGDDFISGNKGDDVLHGNKGDDTVRGRLGDDEMNGGSGDDRLIGDRGNDEIDGAAGDDFIKGGAGSDILEGGKGNDELIGNGKDDIIDGGAGNDTIVGGFGDDTITTGAGKDVIVYNRKNDATDTITDFSVKRDLLDLSEMVDFYKLDASTAFDENILVVQQGSTAVVKFDHDGNGPKKSIDLVNLEDVSANDLSADNFIF